MAVAGGSLYDNSIIESSAKPNGSQAGRLTWKMARRHVIRPGEELDRPFQVSLNVPGSAKRQRRISCSNYYMSRSTSISMSFPKR